VQKTADAAASIIHNDHIYYEHLEMQLTRRHRPNLGKALKLLAAEGLEQDEHGRYFYPQPVA